MKSEDLARNRPGWLSRVFGSESGALVALDARKGETGWVRPVPFRFLYQGRLGSFFLVTAADAWSAIEEAEARDVFAALPVKLVLDLDASGDVATAVSGVSTPAPRRSERK